MEFLAQCNAFKAKESNPACQVQVKRRTDDQPPVIRVTFVNGVEEVFDATATPAQKIGNMILEKGQMLETEGEKWPIVGGRASPTCARFQAKESRRLEAIATYASGQ